MNTEIENLLNHLQSAPFTAHFAALFLDALLKSLVVLGLAGGVCALWRKASAATRHLIWFLGVVSLLCLPMLNSTQPSWQKPVWTISTAASSGNQISLALQLAPNAPSTPSAPSAQNSPDASNASASAGSSSSSPKITAYFNAHWMLFGCFAWLAGVAVVLVRLAGGQYYRRKFSQSAQPLQNAEWTGLLSDACKTLRLRRPVKLLQSADDVMPMTWGWLRPVVLLPAEAADWPEERRRIVLLHELAHVKRGDYLTQTIAQLVCALYWFNPLVWLAARQMCVEREGACDDLVLTGGCKASAYAGHLVEIAVSFQHVPQMAAIAMARSSQLEDRIAAIVDTSRNRRLRSAAALAILALIGGIAICLGGNGSNISSNTGKSDALRQQQIARLEEFSKLKVKQSEALAAAAGERILPIYQRFFDAAINGDGRSVSNLFETVKQQHPQYSHLHQHSDVSLRTSYWSPVLEICMAYDNVVRCHPEYTQMAVDDIINSIPAGSIYFGGTDPGRALPTAFCKSHVDADPFYTLTQNALADGTYLEYLNRTYGNQRALLGQMATACSADKELQSLNTQYVAAVEKANSSGNDDTQWKAADQEVSKLWQKRDDRVKAILAEVRSHLNNQEKTSGPTPIYIPTQADSQRCFEEYITDAKKRLESHQLKPGEDVKVSDGRTQVSGQVAVMEINGLLVKTIFDNNPTNEFYIEESFPLDWMYPYLEPHGLIMKINRQPLSEMSDATVQQDKDFWQPRVTQMIGGWLNDQTSVKDVTAFGEKVFVNHDLNGFTGDPNFVQNDYAPKMFSKWRSSIAGLYAWRAENATSPDEKERMARAADLAFRQALALCPHSPEAVARYEDFLNKQHRDADAKLVQALGQKMKSKSKSAGASTPARPSVFQMRLALDAPTDNTEPMRLESGTGSAQAQTLYLTKEVLLDHTALESATFNKNRLGYPEIDVSLTKAGGKQFAEITQQHLHEKLAIVIDGKLWMAPVVQTPITGGKAQITGSFSDDEGKELVAKINEAVGKGL
jgi:beta-lactamase regulating signal transducer with metallopeptidase domain